MNPVFTIPVKNEGLTVCCGLLIEKSFRASGEEEEERLAILHLYTEEVLLVRIMKRAPEEQRDLLVRGLVVRGRREERARGRGEEREGEGEAKQEKGRERSEGDT